MRGTRMNENVKNVWMEWLDVTQDRCHLHFELEGGSVESHIALCNESSLVGVESVVQDLPSDFVPKRILEIGASVGFISIAFAKYYKNAEVHSVEPDGEASVKQYWFASKILFFFDKIGASKAIIFLLIKTGLYPSVMYTLQKHTKVIDQ